MDRVNARHRLGIWVLGVPAAAVVGFVLGGCGVATSGPAPIDSPYSASEPTDPAVSSAAPESSVIGASRTSDAAPPEFRDREPLPGCGDVVFEQGAFVWPADVVTCLNAAGGPDGPGAEVAVQGPTTEGDPIVTYYRVGAGIDGVEIFTDATQDRYGSGTWGYRTCADTAEFDEAGPLCERA
ncbi:hypothetical protein [Occultella gossypii]|uniref:Secreted protein n=1 Tax=Occultella gossypii TaxID=2800820 RepID=A0ABS7SB53_9MICO|nr:hypothetical protein [Occultella gossypii]MBZ2196511.1 hypothetical protein [Occultella gossypii]